MALSNSQHPLFQMNQQRSFHSRLGQYLVELELKELARQNPPLGTVNGGTDIIKWNDLFNINSSTSPPFFPTPDDDRIPLRSRMISALSKGIPVAIVGGGPAGLRVAMMLHTLGIPYRILEASSRLGGRVYTYHFQKTDTDTIQNYFDVGAMRFPNNLLNASTYGLFKELKFTEDGGEGGKLLPYHYWSPKNHLLYNGIMKTREEVDANPTEDHFKDGVDNGGLVPMKYITMEYNSMYGVDACLEAAFGPFKEALAQDWKKGWKKLMEYDYHSTRSYMLNVMSYPWSVVQWMERTDSGTLAFDQLAFSESVVDSLEFDGPIEWRIIQGGTESLTQAMLTSLYKHVLAVTIKFTVTEDLIAIFHGRGYLLEGQGRGRWERTHKKHRSDMSESVEDITITEKDKSQRIYGAHAVSDLDLNSLVVHVFDRKTGTITILSFTGTYKKHEKGDVNQKISHAWGSITFEGDFSTLLRGADEGRCNFHVHHKLLKSDKPSIVTGKRVTSVRRAMRIVDRTLVPVMALSSEDTSSNVFPTSSSDEVFSHVVLTPPLGCLQAMDFRHCNFDYKLQMALRSLAYSPAVKVGIQFKTRWWQSQEDSCGINGGHSVTDGPSRVVVYPDYGLDEGSDKPGVLMATYNWKQDAFRYGSLIKPNNWSEVLDPERVHPASEIFLLEQIFGDLSRLHGKPESYFKDQMVDYYAFSWYHNPFTMGAYANFGPGELSNLYPSISKPVAGGYLHFGGEAASYHHGWIAGALDSAKRCVWEILATDGTDEQKILFQQIYGARMEFDDMRIAAGQYYRGLFANLLENPGDKRVEFPPL